MHLEYNTVSLELLSLDRVERHNVYDPSGTDLMYVKWLISATCVYSPGGLPVGTAITNITPYTRREATGNTITPNRRQVRGDFPFLSTTAQEENVRGQQPGYTALITDVELRTKLALPRKPLKIWAYDTDGQEIIWLQCPKAGFPCDPINGPRPLGPPDVVDATGEGLTFGVHFQVECATLPVPDGSDQLVLSHRWQMSHESNEDHYLTRMIDGEVVFNAALLQAYKLNPDWFRNQFFHPIPLGFRRHVPLVTLSPDGNVLKYRVEDVDTSITFDAGDSGATQIQIAENLHYEPPYGRGAEQELQGSVLDSIWRNTGGRLI